VCPCVITRCAFLTLKERDNETGLDFAQARYYSSQYGRFTSPDPSLSSGREKLPQSWNRYVYTLNNPLRFVDPSGLYEFDSGLDATQRENFRRQLKLIEKRLKAIKKIYKENSEEYKLAKKGYEAYGCVVGKGCKEDAAGTGRVLIKVGTLQHGMAAHDDLDAANNRSIVTVSATTLSNPNSDIAAELAHEGVHAQDDRNYLDSGKQIKVSDYEAERSAYVVTSAMEEVRPSGNGIKTMGGNTYFTWDEKWKTADPKLSAVENVRNQRKIAIDALLAVPKKPDGTGGLYGTTPQNPGNSYYP